MIKTIFAATLIAILSGMGIGSGGFLVLYLTAIEGVSQLAAQGINLIFFIFSAAASTLLNVKKLSIFWREVGMMTLFGIIGCIGSAFFVGTINEDILQRIFGGMLTLSGAVALIKLLPEMKKK